MLRKLIVLAAGLACASSAAWAYRVIEHPEDAYELALGDVTLPNGAGGSVIFVACEECRTTTLRVSAETQYFVNRSPVGLNGLKETAAQLRDTPAGEDESIVYVFYDRASLRVTRLALSF